MCADSQLQRGPATVPAQIDPSIYDRCLGEFRAGPKDHVIVARESARPVITIAGHRSDTLPIDNSTFFVPGLSDDWASVDNALGRATGHEIFGRGKNILANMVR
jgi:hypothetical protein